MAAIVRAKGNDGTEYFYGPFYDGEQATSWAHGNLRGFEWCWEDLTRPGSTFLPCKVDDLLDFARVAIMRDGECYVTIDNVNWCATR